MYTPISYKKDDPQCEEDNLGNIMNAKVWFKERQKQLKETVRPEDVEDYEGVLNDLTDLMLTIRPGSLNKQLVDMKTMVVMHLPHKVATDEILEAINDIEKVEQEADSLITNTSATTPPAFLLLNIANKQKTIEGKIQDLQEVIKEQYNRIIPNGK